ncbi:MAG: translocation/assembly module TamB domain-containing protein [Alphaproteobacteria bacterium]|nr:translocation/assembly module TamB domain-containing protein [Alphaproteobacteria bacterium]
MWYWPSSMAGRITAIGLSILAVLLVFVVFLLETTPGHVVIGSLVKTFTGGDVVVSGLDGSLPDHIRADRLELRDVDGVWLRAEGITLDWHAIALISNHFDVQSARIHWVRFIRPQIVKPSTHPSTTTIDVDHVVVDRIGLDKAAFGHGGLLTASGSIHYRSRHDFAVDIDAHRLDGDGHYRAHFAIRRDLLSGTATIAESGNGLVGGVFGLPDIGPVNLTMDAVERRGSDFVDVRLQAGDMRGSGTGTVDLAGKTLQVDFTANAPAMRPRADLSWASMTAEGHIHGTFRTPEIRASLRFTDLAAFGYAIRDLNGQLQGDRGMVSLSAVAVDTRVPGSNPNLFAGAPVSISGRANIAAPARPVQFTVDHPLLHLMAQGTLAGKLEGSAKLYIPALGPFAAVAGVALDGPARFVLKANVADNETRFDLSGLIDARGNAVAPALLGRAAKVTASGWTGANGNMTVVATLVGSAVQARLSGGTTNGNFDYHGDVALKDLTRAVASLSGALSLHATLSGKSGNMRLAMSGSGDLGTKGFKRERVMLTADASGLPKLRAADARVNGRFDGSPIVVAASLAGNGRGGWKAAIQRGDWRSAGLRAQFTLARNGAAVAGLGTLQIAKLADLAPLFGVPLSGAAEARISVTQSGTRPVATVHARATGVRSGETALNTLTIDGTITDPLRKPLITATLVLPQFAASRAAGGATLHLSGSIDRLAVALSSSAVMYGNQPVSIDAKALVNAAKSHLVVTAFQGVWKGQTVTLASPATFDLSDGGLVMHADFTEGKAARVTVNGTMPLKSGQPWNLHATAHGNVGQLTSSLAAIGQNLNGNLAADVAVTGTLEKPYAVGKATLTGGEYHDAAYGISLRNLDVAVAAQGAAVKLTHFSAQAGQGTITGSGTADLSAPGTPVDMTFSAHNAKPMVSDLATATMDADLKLKGKLSDHMVLSGTLRAINGNINIPQSFPPTVAVLNVQRSRIKPPPPSPPALTIGLDMTVTSPGRIFVRGRGIVAEFSGDLKITGTSQTPVVLGALTMRQGTLSLAGATLTFTSGTIRFEGAGLRDRLDPTLDLSAQSVANGITATLAITGTVSQPKLGLTSSPALPQDEILAQLLFQRSVKQLSPLELAQIGQAVASFGGVGSGFDPIASMRRSLGLDRLSIGSTPAATGTTGSTTVEAGKYVMHNVYVGARQDLSGGTHALVQVDITKNLKAQASVTTGTKATATSTPLQDNGDSLGVTYQFEY